MTDDRQQPSAYARRGRDNQLHLFGTPGDLHGCGDYQLLKWDGRGTVSVIIDEFRHWLSRPEPGDEFIVDGWHLVIIEMSAWNRYARCMAASIAAHRLAQFYLTYKAGWITHWSLFNANLDVYDHQSRWIEQDINYELARLPANP